MTRRGTGSAAFLRDVVAAQPGRTVVVVSAMVVAALAEGVGLAALLPVLELAVGGGDSGAVAQAGRLLARLGLPVTVPVLLGLIVAMLGLKAVFRWLALRQVGWSVAALARELRSRLVRALLEARWGHLVGSRTGELAAASGEAFWAGWAYRHAAASLAALVQVAVYGLVIAWISWRLALAAVCVGVLLTVLLAGLVRRSRQAGMERLDRVRELAAGLTDVMQGLKPVKAMGRERAYSPLLEAEARRVETAERGLVSAGEALRTIQEPILAAVLAVGVGWALAVGHALPVVLVTVVLFQRIVSRLHQAQVEYQGMVANESAYRAVRRTTRRAEEAREEDGAGLPAPGLDSGLRLERVTFAHAASPVLDGVSVELPAGALVAVTGPSGAGKTTLVDLLLGLLRPTSGRVLVDGVPLTDVDRAGWRRLVGYVPQETVLLHDTVARNVALGGAPDVARLRRALESAGALAFVEALPEGVETVVGERGARLSGGQRQRISIARALYGGPRLLVLDEATTGLDPATEAGIAETLRGLRGSVTVVAVTHGARLLDVADLVLEVAAGAVRVAAGRDAS